jgi:DNA repair protein RadC
MIEQKTGGLLGYVGEWHTHPKGRPVPSPKDMATVGRIKSTLDKVGLPFHLMIVNSDGCYSYLY